MEKIRAVSRIDAVVFDLDGTLVDSLADIAFAVNTTLAAHGREPHPLSSYNAMVGWGLRQLLATASGARPFPEAEFETAYQELLAAYRARPVAETRPYPGITGLVAGLGARIPLGILSNKEDGMVRTIVSSLFPAGSFRTVWGARPGKASKPDPEGLREMLGAWGVDPGACAYLGDSDVDMETARRAGVVACGAGWGFRGAAELEAAGALAVFPDPGSFGAWLDLRIVRN